MQLVLILLVSSKMQLSKLQLETSLTPGDESGERLEKLCGEQRGGERMGYTPFHGEP